MNQKSRLWRRMLVAFLTAIALLIAAGVIIEHAAHSAEMPKSDKRGLAQPTAEQQTARTKPSMRSIGWDPNQSTARIGW